jgi:hypothetical protein
MIRSFLANLFHRILVRFVVIDLWWRIWFADRFVMIIRLIDGNVVIVSRLWIGYSLLENKNSEL